MVNNDIHIEIQEYLINLIVNGYSISDSFKLGADKYVISNAKINIERFERIHLRSTYIASNIIVENERNKVKKRESKKVSKDPLKLKNLKHTIDLNKLKEHEFKSVILKKYNKLRYKNDTSKAINLLINSYELDISKPKDQMLMKKILDIIRSE